MFNIAKACQFVRHENTIAAGTTTITPSAGVDTAGFETCVFLVEWGAIVASGVQSVEVHQSKDDSSYAALQGSKVVVAEPAPLAEKVMFIPASPPPPPTLCAVRPLD